jgi:hypothetical protein
VSTTVERRSIAYYQSLGVTAGDYSSASRFVEDYLRAHVQGDPECAGVLDQMELEMFFEEPEFDADAYIVQAIGLPGVHFVSGRVYVDRIDDDETEA